ncbi:MAG: DUF4004 family protein [Sarcina sp.]
MEEKLISKKELLDLTGISYGQLYRWKRKNIIPEDWFIKKSVSTGQETFLPYDKVLERIKIILEAKDTKSLDELAQMFSSEIKVQNIRKEYLIDRNIFSEMVVDKFEEMLSTGSLYSGRELLLLEIFNELIIEGSLNVNEIKSIILSIKDGYDGIGDGDYIIIKRKLGVMFYYLSKTENDIFKDDLAKIIFRIDFDKVKQKINKF